MHGIDSKPTWEELQPPLDPETFTPSNEHARRSLGAQVTQLAERVARARATASPDGIERPAVRAASNGAPPIAAGRTSSNRSSLGA
jgi:hypothetical protein